MEALALGTALFFTTGNIINKNKSKKQNSDLDKRTKFVLTLRNPKSYSKTIRKIIDLITIENDVYPVGSQQYKIHGYPSDIDLMEKIKVCCDIVDTIGYVAKHLKKIAKRIKTTDRIYLGDFKAGVDDRFDHEIGWINLNNKLVGFKPKAIKQKLYDSYTYGFYTTIQNIKELEYIDNPVFEDFFNSLRNKQIVVGGEKNKLGDWYDKNKTDKHNINQSDYKFWEKYLKKCPKQFTWVDKQIQYLNIFNKTKTSGLLSQEEYSKLIILLPNNSKDIHKWEKFRDEYRKFLVFRWNIDELIAGEKIVKRKNTTMKVSLKSALLHESVVKLDVWAKVNNNYIEITNYLLLMYLDKKGNPKYVNTPMGDYIQKLIYDINHYTKSENPKYMKAAKRIWSIAVHQEDKDMLNKLYKLFSSDASVLYQISAEIETIIDMFNILSHPPFDEIIDQIERFKNRINVVYNISTFTKEEENEIYTFIDDAIDIFNNNKNTIYKKSKNKYCDKIIKILKFIMEKLDTNVNLYTMDYLKKNKIKIDIYNKYIDKKLVLYKPLEEESTGYIINPDLSYELDWNITNNKLGEVKRKAMKNSPGQAFKIVN